MVEGKRVSKLVGILADVGEGKTALMTYILYQDYMRGNDVIANYHLNFPRHESAKFSYMDIDTIHKLFQDQSNEELSNATLGLDEAHMGLDSRLALRRLNMRLGYLATQRRKRNLDIYFTSQRKFMTDIRIRSLCDYYIQIEKISNKPLSFRYRAVNPETFESMTRWVYFTPTQKHLDMYDTNEIIAEPES